jgi:chromosome segregation ATPase
MEPEITAKSTKNEILEAYNELLARLKEQKTQDRQAERARAEKKEIVETAAQNSEERIVKGLADLKLRMTKALDEMEEQLIAEFKRLNGVRQAIDIEQKNLQEVHEIRATADGLAALLLAQREKKEAFERDMEQRRADFEAEMAQKRQQWKREQEEFERQKKEREEQVKRTREREEEEYTYNLKLQRKKDQDGYEARKAALEKELEDKRQALERSWAEREAALAAREKELADLRARVEAFPKELEKAVRDTEKAVTERLEFKHRHEAEMRAKEIEGERRLSQQVIDSLEARIKEQDEQIRQLTQRANEAGLQVQSIAVKAIEGASAWRALATAHERGGEPAGR